MCITLTFLMSNHTSKGHRKKWQNCLISVKISQIVVNLIKYTNKNKSQCWIRPRSMPFPTQRYAIHWVISFEFFSDNFRTTEGEFLNHSLYRSVSQTCCLLIQTRQRSVSFSWDFCRDRKSENLPKSKYLRAKSS